MTQYQTLIVGAHFRPPAKQLLAVLAAGHPLRLVEDNENQYDSAAVKVMLDLVDEDGLACLAKVQLDQLESDLPNAGLTLEQLMSSGPVQLGFVPMQEGKPLAKARATEPLLLGNQQVRELMMEGGYDAELGFAPDGSPRLMLEPQLAGTG